MVDTGDSRSPNVFVLERELSEVYLLLDNISTNLDDKLPATAADVPAGLDKEWLKQVCDIEWPPAKVVDKAKEASLLIRTKDFLNTLAKPASGASIAFTLLAMQDDSDIGHHSGRNGYTPSRGSLARDAYPDFIPRARRFRRMLFWLACFLVLCLIATSLLSWDIAYGNAAIRQMSVAQANVDSAIQQVEATEVPPKTEGGNPVQQPPIVKTAKDLCDTAKRVAATPFAGSSGYASISQLQACEAFMQAGDARASARAALAWWLHPFTSVEYMKENPTGDYLAEANALASTWGNGVLPFLFGLLGAGAAIVRDLSRKIKLSLLTPRDFTLSLQQLALGAVTGACIGLFMAQPGSSATSSGTGLGPVALTGSALSFVAGFGVDGVFRTIDGIIGRIFNIPAPPDAPGAAAPGNAGAGLKKHHGKRQKA